MGVAVLLALAGCTGRWLEVSESRSLPRDRTAHDYRIMLRNDSVVVLHDAISRNDSLVEVSGATPRAVALGDIAHLESWQPGGERVTGGIALTIVAGLLGFIYVIAHAVS